MTKEETIKYLGLDSISPSEETGEKSVFDIDQNLYGKIFTLLDRNDCDWEEDSSEIDNGSDDKMTSKYFCNGGELTLEADLDNNTYKITIKDVEED